MSVIKIYVVKVFFCNTRTPKKLEASSWELQVHCLVCSIWIYMGELHQICTVSPPKQIWPVESNLIEKTTYILVSISSTTVRTNALSISYYLYYSFLHKTSVHVQKHGFLVVFQIIVLKKWFSVQNWLWKSIENKQNSITNILCYAFLQKLCTNYTYKKIFV